jgi:hypothetical protein
LIFYNNAFLFWCSVEQFKKELWYLSTELVWICVTEIKTFNETNPSRRQMTTSRIPLLLSLVHSVYHTDITEMFLRSFLVSSIYIFSSIFTVNWLASFVSQIGVSLSACIFLSNVYHSMGIPCVHTISNSSFLSIRELFNIFIRNSFLLSVCLPYIEFCLHFWNS